MIEVEDQLGRKISLKKTPNRIISIVPSQTELLADLGLEEEVVGITKFCVHPEHWFRSKTRIGGTKNLNIDKIKALQPDLIIANQEENDKEQVEELSKHFPIWISDVKTLEDTYAMISSIGKICGKPEKAKIISEKIRLEFESLKTDFRIPAAYFIWRKPYMAVGGDTFINEMLEKSGFENVLKNQNRYPEVNLSKLKSLNPEVILLSSEPFPFQKKHIGEIQQEIQGVKIQIVDGEMFSWYGSRLIGAAKYFRQLQKDIFETKN